MTAATPERDTSDQPHAALLWARLVLILCVYAGIAADLLGCLHPEGEAAIFLTWAATVMAAPHPDPTSTRGRRLATDLALPGLLLALGASTGFGCGWLSVGGGLSAATVAVAALAVTRGHRWLHRYPPAPALP